MGLPFGMRFQPTEQELVGYFLRKKIQGLPLSELESKLIIDRETYGENATPWEIFNQGLDQNNQPILPWLTPVDPMGKFDAGLKNLYLFTKLTDREKSDPNNRVAGCGTWNASNDKEAVYARDNSGPTSTVIGYRRSFTFRSSTTSPEDIGQWNLTEYCADPVGLGLNPSELNIDFADYVLCKIERHNRLSSLLTNASSQTSSIGEELSSVLASTSSGIEKENKGTNVDGTAKP